MRTVDYTKRFKKDYKREKAGRHRAVLDKILEEIVMQLALDKLLPQNKFDHALTGNWSGSLNFTKYFHICYYGMALKLYFYKIVI